MSNLPLEVDEVLIDEFCALYNDEPKAVAYDEFEILDDQEEWACALLHDCGATADAKQPATIIAALKAFVNGDADKAKKLHDSRAITETGRVILDDYDDYAESENKQKLNRRIVDQALHGAIKPLRDMRLEKVYSALHEKQDDDARAAFCISGGGIRSATFAFGIIQGLASAGILKKFDFLSTVSGGGYIGGWLSSWIRRHPKGVTGVQDDLVRADSATTSKPKLPQSKVDPEPTPIRHLRDYSNYLSPKLGVASIDSWTMASLYVRNMLLNLLVLVPILAGVLAAPRYASVLLSWAERRQNLVWPHLFLAASIAFLVWGFGYIGAGRPVTQGTKGKRSSPNKAFLFNCILPLTLAATSLCLFWAKEGAAADTVAALQPFAWWVGAAFIAMVLWPALLYYVRYWMTPAAELHTGLTSDSSSHRLKKMSNEFVAAAVAFGTAMLLLILVAFEVFPDPTRPVVDNVRTLPFLRSFINTAPEAQLFICFAVPLLLIVFFVQASIFVGLSGRLNEDSDREWWGRAGAYLLFFAAILGVGSVIAVLGPVYLYRAPIILGSIGGVSGVASALLGFSAKTPANDKQKKDATKTSSAMNAVSALAVPLFVVIALAAISLGTTELMQVTTGTGVELSSAQFTSQFESQATATEKVEFQGRTYEVKTESPKTATAVVPMMHGIAHLRTIEATTWLQALLIIGVALGAFGLSFFVGVNRFSMHALYRNRLVRGYLAASRYNRDPDPFTGFDEHDNVEMSKLRPELVWSSSFADPKAFLTALVTARAGSGEDKSLADAIWANLGRAQKRLVPGKDVTGALLVQLTMAINEVLLRQDLTALTPLTAAKFAKTKDRVKRNRQILDNRFPAIGAYADEHTPLHIINAALNLTSAEKLGWQERQAESFTVSPLHCGSLYLGYRPSNEYGGDEGISVGTAVTISGAAASPNMGYHSSPPLAFLLTLLNVRLGWWLGNPGIAGTGVYTNANPSSNVNLLFKELTGQSDATYSWVYLSDGGHFENLGIYEMVLRRCRYIVVSDAGSDPKYTFEDLGNAIRKIRIDLGVPIEIEHMYMLPRTPETVNFPDGRYVATANIRYSAIDANGVDGKLIYIKPGLYSEDYFPKDVYNYALSSSDFPHESTADQFFSESQFESYRALGRHAIDEICGNYKPRETRQYKSVAEFASKIVPQPTTTKEPPPMIAAAATAVNNAADALNHAATSVTAMLEVKREQPPA